jgi:hypothetical protein
MYYTPNCDSQSLEVKSITINHGWWSIIIAALLFDFELKFHHFQLNTHHLVYFLSYATSSCEQGESQVQDKENQDKKLSASESAEKAIKMVMQRL